MSRNRKMTTEAGTIRQTALKLLMTLVTTAYSAPTIAFPFNSQVPAVARANEPYLFQISASTFAPNNENLTYSISNQPSWLRMDSATRTLSGTPDESNVGASEFTLTAADENGVAHAPCIIIVSGNPAPKLEGDISKQFAGTTNLSSTNPLVVSLLPSTSFGFKFQQDSFIDIVQRRLYYYATLSDHTPLPSWLSFNPSDLSFSGTAPELSAFPQAWEIALIASDVQGFAGTNATFTLAIGKEQLVFNPAEQEVNVTAGQNLQYSALESQLFRNGELLPARNLSKAETSSLPPWLSFDPSTLSFCGTVPSGGSNASVLVTVTDSFGDSATAQVNFVTGEISLITRTLGALTAYAGQFFQYEFPATMFSQSNLQLQVVIPTSANWLQYDNVTKTLQGQAPLHANGTSITASLIAEATSGAPAETQTFTINVEAPSGTYPPVTQSSTAAAVLSSSSRVHKHLAEGVITAIVIACVLAIPVTAGLIIFCTRSIHRKRVVQYERYVANLRKRNTISRPFLHTPETAAVGAAGHVHRDVEKQATEDELHEQSRVVDRPPQIQLDLPTQSTSKPSKWLKRFSRLSIASSIGVGEDAIRADTNIPEWGHQSTALHKPHDSFSVPAEMARMSRHMSESLPTKRAMQRLHGHRRSRQTIGLGIDTGLGYKLPKHCSRNTRHRRQMSSLGLSVTIDQSSQASISTRSTSVLSAKPSDFPRPPNRPSFPQSQPNQTMYAKVPHSRKSIRLVDRSDSTADQRSVAEKRQSFIRNRASTSTESPLFAHGSRATSKAPIEASSVPSTNASSRRPRRGRSTLKSYSESSSLEPQWEKESRRLSARVQSAFPPNYPRAVTQSTLQADDEGAGDREDSSSGFETVTSSTNSGDDWIAQLALPRHQRSWVIPGEASPTPPPVLPTSRDVSSARRSTPSMEYVHPRQYWQQRVSDLPPPLRGAKAIKHKGGKVSQPVAARAQKRRINEPISLVSTDSVNAGTEQRPRLGQTNSNRPVSVEHVTRLSSLKADTGTEEETEMSSGQDHWEDLGEEEEEAQPDASASDMAAEMSLVGVASAKETQRSDRSGPAFL